MSERIPQIRIGLSEAAHVTSKRNGVPLPNSLYPLPLSHRVRHAAEMGFDSYEAMPTPSTAVSTLFLRHGRIAQVQQMIVNIHTPWTDDRYVSPDPAATDTRLKWQLRNTASTIMSAGIYSYSTLGRLATETKASVSTHWPHPGSDISGISWEENIRRKLVQHELNTLNVPLIAETHALIGMTDEEMHAWLTVNESRGLVFVSGNDSRDEEYQGLSSVSPSEHIAFVRGVYVKDGWSSDVLRRDLSMIRNGGNSHDLWIMVNTSDGANRKTSDQLHEIVEQINKG